MANFLNDPDFVKLHLAHFINFMGRDGYSAEMAQEEFPRLRETVGLDANPKKYLFLPRTGSRFPLDRRKKVMIALTYHKAGDHAYFAYSQDLSA
ncbi:hypothetical protein [Microvirga massiliensis]|uniref:hypothetical protein n=1 Tax=Microvirga massiliensis TaxID=1033741 RepID=UPI00062BF0D4|nr:hypothetical protein [Microvirga massiliensis]